MAKPTARTRTFTRPRLAVPQGVPEDAADRLWMSGEAAEAAYDFETAREYYLAAALAAAPAQSLEYVERYAAFLVQRFGQFAEVAAWLDDAEFQPPVDVATPTALALCRNLARAALEVGHPRAQPLDAALAALGEPESLLRTAQRLTQRGQDDAARTLLEQHAVKLPPLGAAVQLLERLRAEAAKRSAAALEPVETALAARDAHKARQALEQLRPAWEATAAFLSAQAHVAAAEAQAAASELRRKIEEALDRADLAAAREVARALCALDVAMEGDRHTLAGIQRLERDAALAARVAAVQEAPDEATTLGEMAALFDAFGASAAVPFAGTELGALWATVQEAASAGAALAGRARDLQALQALRVALACGEDERAQDGLAALPSDWHKLPAAQKARTIMEGRRDAAVRQAAALGLQAVRDSLQAGAVEQAAQALGALPQPPPSLAAEWKQLRQDIQLARQQQARRQRLESELSEARAKQDFFAARRLLAELAPHLPQERLAQMTGEIDAAAAPALAAKAMPPGMQKLADAALITGVGMGRLIVAQDSVWMAINLETGGLQPYALPAAWPLSTEGHARLAEVDGQIRVTGLSHKRLAVFAQRPGQPPQVLAAAGLADLLRGDDLLVGSAMQPDAPRFCLLSRSSQRPGASTWTRIDAASLAVVDHRRTQPVLASVCGIAGLPDRTLVATTVRERQTGGWAVALADDRGEPLQRFSNEDVGEAIAGLRDAVAWPAQDRIYASFSVFDPFEPTKVHAEPSLLVLRGGRVIFASSDLRRRFAPADRIAIDHAWTLDPAAGRLWFAALSTDDAAPGAFLLGVDARTLRADKPVALTGVQRVLSLLPTTGGAAALCRQQAGGYALVRAQMTADGLSLTTHKLPL